MAIRSMVMLLEHRAVLRLSSPRIQGFLQSALTTNMATLQRSAPACLLDPKGRLQYEFTVIKESDTSYLLDVHKNHLDSVIQTIQNRDLRKRIQIEHVPLQVWECVSLDNVEHPSWMQDVWLSAGAEGWTAYRGLFSKGVDMDTNHAMMVDPSNWDLWKYAHGLVEGWDNTVRVFPMEAGLHEHFQAISLNKGCYMGQEPTNRMSRLGPNRHVYSVLLGKDDITRENTTDLPSVGTALLDAGSKRVGYLGPYSSTWGGLASAVIRLDAKDDIMCKGLKVHKLPSPSVDGSTVTWDKMVELGVK